MNSAAIIYDGPRWCAILLRDPEVKFGKGLLCFLYGGDLVDSFWVITGGVKPNPHDYGGLQPPIYWLILEYMLFRKHPNHKRGKMTMSRIRPLFENEAEEYGKRSYETEGDNAVPFMGHAGSEREGSSTGCTADLEDFVGFQGYWNAMVSHAAKHGYNPIQMTRDAPLTSLRNTELLLELLGEHYEEFVKRVWPEIYGGEFGELETEEPNDFDDFANTTPPE